MVNFGVLTAEIRWRVWGTRANFNGFCVLPSLLQRRRLPEANQTLRDVWPSSGLVHYIYIFGISCLLTEFLPRAKFTFCPSTHHRTSFFCYIFATKASIDNRKKSLLNSNMSYRCLHNMVNFGPLTADIDWRVWGTPSYFNGYRVFAALLHGSQVVGVSQTLRC